MIPAYISLIASDTCPCFRNVFLFFLKQSHHKVPYRNIVRNHLLSLSMCVCVYIYTHTHRIILYRVCVCVHSYRKNMWNHFPYGAHPSNVRSSHPDSVFLFMACFVFVITQLWVSLCLAFFILFSVVGQKVVLFHFS